MPLFPSSIPLGGTPQAPPPADPTDLVAATAGGVRRYNEVIYAQVMGYRPLCLDLLIPDGSPSLPPIVVVIHGGGWSMGRRGLDQAFPVNFAMLAQRLLDGGFAVASADYRLTGEAIWPAQIQDLRAAVRWLRTAGPVLGFDASRLGVIGESAGGHLSLMLGTNASNPSFDNEDGVRAGSVDVQAAVAWYPPTDLFRLESQRLPESPADHSSADAPESLLIGAAVEDHRELADSASPITYVSAASAPTLLIHGDHDVVVPFEQSVSFESAMQRVGASARLLAVHGADHCFLGADDEPLIDASVEHFRKHLSS